MISVQIYGKPGCQICEVAKEKMRLLQVEFEFRNIEKALELHDGWRTDGSVAVMAAYHSHNLALPIIFIDGVDYNYPGAMKELKRRLSAKPEKPSADIEELPDI